MTVVFTTTKIRQPDCCQYHLLVHDNNSRIRTKVINCHLFQNVQCVYLVRSIWSKFSNLMYSSYNENMYFTHFKISSGHI